MYHLTGTAKDLTVLLAEPDPLAAERVSRWLQEQGYTVAGVVERGDDALAAIAASRPDLAVIDASLPCPESPRATALEIRDRLGVPVLLTTGHSNDTLLPDGPGELSHEEVLAKPFGPDDLAAAIEVAVSRRGAGLLWRAWDEAFRRAADTIPCFVMILDGDRRIRFINRAGAVLAGTSRTALTGQDAIETVLPLFCRDGTYLRQRLGEERDVLFVADRAAAGGCRVPVRWTCQPARDPGGNCAGWVCLGTEASGAGSLELSLQAGMLRQIEENIEDLSTLNDRIRNPLQVIAAFAGFMEDGVRERVMLQVETINEVIRQLDRRALESTAVREYLRKHHRMAAPKDRPDIRTAITAVPEAPSGRAPSCPAFRR